MRYARLLEPYKGYWDIQVDEDSITGGYHGYEYNCTVITGSLTNCPQIFLIWRKWMTRRRNR